MQFFLCSVFRWILLKEFDVHSDVPRLMGARLLSGGETTYELMWAWLLLLWVNEILLTELRE